MANCFSRGSVGLVMLSQQFVVDISKLEYQTLIVALLRRAALAAPMIWMGWYAAKQVGRLNRVQEDYEYKAATALAFESYKKEVADIEDNDLMRDLLKKTIDNFGDNPVRLYEHASKDSATPSEDLLKKLESDGTIKILEKLRTILWPSA